MKTIVLLIVLLFSSTCFAQTAMYQYNITLRNNDTAIIQPEKYLKMTKYDELRIAQNFSNSLVSSTILKAMGVDAYKSQIDKYCREVFVGVYKCYGVLPSYSGKLDFVHNIIRIKKVRDLCLQLASSTLCELCRLYPKDFTYKMNKQLSIIEEFFTNYSQHEYEAVVDAYGNYNLYIDGKESNYFAHMLPGFLIRRVIFDQVPTQEIVEAARKLKNDMKSVNIENNKSIFCKVTINNEVDFCCPASLNYYYFRKGNDTCYVYPPVNTYSEMLGESTIKYYKDNGESYYMIETGYVNYKNQWRPYTDIRKQKILLDNNGNVIYRE